MTILTGFEAAIEEIQNKSIERIQCETAITQASRAAAAYFLFAKTGYFHWYTLALEFQHEALEHAALSGNDALVVKIRLELKPFENKADTIMSQFRAVVG